jgi:hypothetical protein
MFRYLDPRPLVAAFQNFLNPVDSTPEAPDGVFSPTHADVCVARAILKSCGLPTEVVLEILDQAEYEPVIQFGSTETCIASAPGNPMRQCLTASVLTQDTIRSLAARQSIVKVKEIEFVITSRDQGWTSERTDGTFNTSSWLEVSILRPMPNRSSHSNGPPKSSKFPAAVWQSPATLQPMLVRSGETLVARPEQARRGIQDGEGDLAWYLQGNRVASQGRFEEYRVSWATDLHEGNEGSGDGLGFLEALREGDEIVVWARAKVSFSGNVPQCVLTLTSIRDGNVWLKASM